jgi:hypothetical protein
MRRFLVIILLALVILFVGGCFGSGRHRLSDLNTL